MSEDKPVNPFPCTKCGQCCKLVKVWIPDWPHVDEKTGWCKFLLPDNTCSIYNTRPLECNISATYDAYPLQKTHGWSKLEWYRQNANMCNIEQERAGLPKLYRIEIGDIK